MSTNLKSIAEQAMAEGQKIDLSGCCYGETDWDSSFIDYPGKYYFFLAGFVRTLKITSILEIGTHYGGSIMSMSKGLIKNNQEYKLATIDKIYKNEEGFKKYPSIKRITGESFNRKVIKEALGYFDSPIDLLFIDATHTYKHTKKHIKVYGKKLNPRYIILDDIHLNSDMEKLWNEIIEKFKNRAFDASEISKRGKWDGSPGTAGFGVIQWRSK